MTLTTLPSCDHTAAITAYTRALAAADTAFDETHAARAAQLAAASKATATARAAYAVLLAAHVTAREYALTERVAAIAAAKADYATARAAKGGAA